MLRKFLLVFTLLFFGSISFSNAEANSKPTYTITPSSTPHKEVFTNYSTYNKHTKHYYVIRSYLERLEKTDGGTLVLKQGTYKISNLLAVPSNVTIKLKSGAKIVKSNKTGTSQFSASKSIFHFVRPSLRATDGAHSGFDGEKNISIIGSGNATIDLNYVQDSLAIVAAHNRNVTIENIHFKNMHAGHFIEIDATKDAVIKNNTFKHSKASPNRNKEAINVDYS